MTQRRFRQVVLGLGGFITILILIYLFFVARSQPVPAHAFFAPPTTGTVLVIAHQGGDGLRPSNTMLAFEHAVSLGVDVLEMDIHSTRDGVLVTIHDDTIDRTTDGTGRVQDYTFEQLQAFDAAYHWPTVAEEAHRTDRPYRGQGITIPALEAIFEQFGHMRMNIEIKQKMPSIVVPFCRLLRDYDLTDQVLVASFHKETIEEFRLNCPEVPTSAVQDEITLYFGLNVVGLSPAYQPIAHAFQVPERFGGLQVITPGFVANTRRHNVAVHVWTVNNAEAMQRMIDAGVDGIITDYPDILLSLLNR